MCCDEVRSWINASWLDVRSTGYVEAAGCTDSEERVTFEMSAYTLICRFGDRFICRSVFGVP